MNTTDDRNPDESRSTMDQGQPTKPDKLGVYDRPERQRLSPVMLIILLILALVVAYFLWQLIF
jgi:hypothetical protein